MKKHRVDGSFGVGIFGIFWCIMLIGILVGPTIMMNRAGADYIPIPFIIVGLFMFTIGFILIFTSFKGAILKKKIITLGKRGTARVVRKNYHSSKNGGYHLVEVEYTAETGNKEISVFTVYRYDDYFKEGKSIPVYIWDVYAYYIEDEAKNYRYSPVEELMDNKETDDFVRSNPSYEAPKNDYEDDKYNTKNEFSDMWDSSVNDDCICNKCGTIVKAGLLYCPKCGEAVESNTKCENEYHSHRNYCPECGARVADDDKFCRECGYRLK